MTSDDNLYRVTKADLAKRRGDRRRMALQALADAARQHEKDQDVLPSLTPENLAEAWRVHPTSAFRVLQRLLKAGAVVRAGTGVGAEYQITEKGYTKLEWMTARARIEAKAAKPAKGRQRGAAANPEDES